MVYFALGIYTIGMILTFGGSAYVSIQKRKGKLKFQDEEYVKKFKFNIRIIAVSMILIAFVILFIMGN